MNNVLLDTNLLIYAIDEDSKYFHSVQNLLNDDRKKFFITSKNISEFHSVVTRFPKISTTIVILVVKCVKFFVMPVNV